jgi:DNA repair exonuclease SbcCD ATPase subunit
MCVFIACFVNNTLAQFESKEEKISEFKRKWRNDTGHEWKDKDDLQVKYVIDLRDSIQDLRDSIQDLRDSIQDDVHTQTLTSKNSEVSTQESCQQREIEFYKFLFLNRNDTTIFIDSLPSWDNINLSESIRKQLQLILNIRELKKNLSEIKDKISEIDEILSKTEVLFDKTHWILQLNENVKQNLDDAGKLIDKINDTDTLTKNQLSEAQKDYYRSLVATYNDIYEKKVKDP